MPQFAVDACNRRQLEKKVTGRQWTGN